MFTAMGIVKDVDGNPLQGVKVTLEISSTSVYKAITPVQSESTLTDDKGEFIFEYISHEKDPPYNLSFEKDGYEVVAIKKATQDMNPHPVILKRQTN
jgi:hypothetical protein